jgi:hypothetical protein
MLEAADLFCKTYDGVTFASNIFQSVTVEFGWQEVHKSGLNILVRLETKSNCQWNVNKAECNKQFVNLVDGCDQEGIIDKQGGVRENDCLIWRIDLEQNSDDEPPKPKPSSPPPAPKQPEIKDGIKPAFDLYTTSFGISGGNLPTTWVFGQQAISYYGRYKTCNAAYGWSDGGGVSGTNMPGEITGITKVFGKTCDYKNNGVDYGKASDGDQVGWLKCGGWDDAKCFKESTKYFYDNVGVYQQITCMWGVK